MKTQHCDECKHATMRALPKPVLICAMLHKPRFRCWKTISAILKEKNEML